MKKAIIIIPTYNERENIQRLLPILDEVFNRITTWQMEILVVDDTSPDKTYEVVKALQRSRHHLHLLINKRKAGLGGAYLKGMEYAISHLGADAVFEFDADLSHDPSKIPDFLTKIDEGYDLVLGSRYVKGGGIPDNWGLHRKFMSVVGNLVIMVVWTNFSIRDWTTGYRCLTKELFNSVKEDLKSERFSGYAFQIGFLHQALKKGFKVAEVPFKFVDRTIGQSKLGSEYVKNALLFVLKVRFEEIVTNRIFKFLAVGGLGTVVQLSALMLYRALLPQFSYWLLTNFLVATFLSIETAIVSNFIFNNIWTFADRQLKTGQIPSKFIQFNLASGGSVLIQLAVAVIGENVFGLFALFTIPILNRVYDTGAFYAMLGIVIGLFWNFFAYNKFICHLFKHSCKTNSIFFWQLS